MLDNRKEIIVLVAFTIILIGVLIRPIQRNLLLNHDSVSGIAHPGIDFSLSLDDGASINISGDSIIEESEIIIERNPKKSKSLPSPGDHVVQLSDIYDFQVNGLLIGPFELTIPFDKSKISSPDGILVAGFPSRWDWSYLPVNSNTDEVVFETFYLWDPVVVSFFPDVGDQVDMSYDLHNPLTVCDPQIQIEAVKKDIGTSVIGRVKPIDAGYEGIDTFHSQDPRPPSNIEVSVSLSFVLRPDSNDGRWPPGGGHTGFINTDEDGSFSTIFTNDDLYSDSINIVSAEAVCDDWFGIMPVISRGQVEVIPAPSLPE
jgi:hypothetical protein